MSSQVGSFPTVNRTAFCTIVALAVGTGGSAFAAATAATTVATVAYAILAITGAAISFASISAWLDPSSTTVEKYFSNCSKHAGYTVAGAYQFVAQVLVQALVRGLADGITNLVSDKITGNHRNRRA